MFNFKWYLKDKFVVPGVKKHGCKVFSTFACGGGSTMGYKLAGYDVIGANDIDEKMKEAYTKNLHPKLYFKMPIKEMLTAELPDELYHLDILDGSPPCSTFSMAGARESAWKKDKKFREGQEKQVLSDLFFDWIALVNKLQPKIAVAENVKGMLAGNAKAYTANVISELEKIGYDVQLFCFDASTMGVPQKRERVFFICRRKDLKLPKVNFNFNQNKINLKEIEKVCSNPYGPVLSEAYRKWWVGTPVGKSFSFAHPKGSFFNTCKLDPQKCLPTITATTGAKLTHYAEPYQVSDEILILAGTFPVDYEFTTDVKYLIGMSVPPVMMANIAYEIWLQLLK